MTEPVTSRRIQVINFHTSDIHDDVSNLNESLVDKEKEESLAYIDSIRTKLNILKEQVTNGDII